MGSGFVKSGQAAAFLQTWLPEEISEKLDLSTLQRYPDTYVDEQLQEHLMDMVYTCDWKGSPETVKVSFLFEHKFEEKVTLLSRLIEKRFDVGVIADISGLSPVFVQEFISGYNQEAWQQLLQFVALARQTKEPAAAADILRQGMATYGFSKQTMEGYFTAMG